MAVKANPRAVPTGGRRLRSPAHNFYLRHRPFTIQPFMLAPVLPGETLKSFTLQARAVLDPIKNPLIGWWIEYHLYYVKHRDLDARDTLTEMMLDPTTSLASLLEDAKNAPYYQYQGAVKWAELCTKRVVEEYFRDEGEADTAGGLMDGLYLAKVNDRNWMESYMLESAFPDGDTLSGSGGETQTQLDRSYNQWQFLVANALTQMSYEDYLRSYGVRSSRIELHRPELVRMVRNWSYPTNSVDPTDGSVASTVSWAVAERGDKDIFFSEPGFLLGLSVVRPKVYFGRLQGSAAGALNDAYAWLPAIMRDEVYTSLKTFTTGTGPNYGASAAYVVDLRDLYLYGDQFVTDTVTSEKLSATDRNYVTLPSDDSTNSEFPLETDIEAMFVTADVDACRQDGRCTLNILGTQVDHT